jgi:hypothetical protein
MFTAVQESRYGQWSLPVRSLGLFTTIQESVVGTHVYYWTEV